MEIGTRIRERETLHLPKWQKQEARQIYCELIYGLSQIGYGNTSPFKGQRTYHHKNTAQPLSNSLQARSIWGGWIHTYASAPRNTLKPKKP